MTTCHPLGVGGQGIDWIAMATCHPLGVGGQRIDWIAMATCRLLGIKARRYSKTGWNQTAMFLYLEEATGFQVVIMIVMHLLREETTRDKTKTSLQLENAERKTNRPDWGS